MSYILEALKKAQAERQLGSAPTIHATPLQPLASERERTRSMGLIAGLGVLAVAVAGGVAWWTQRTPAPDAQPGAVLAATPAPPAPVVVVAQAPQAPAAPYVPAAPAPLAYQAGPAPTPVMGASAVIAQRPPVMRAAPAPAPARAAATALVAVAAAPAAALEENLPLLNQLPEAQRAGLPQVSFGGYMYSKNPADRLLLIDKTLRREGEEVAPGLVLERLLPRAAVMNYRGTRYRVPY